VLVTAGWGAGGTHALFRARIVDLYPKTVGRLGQDDLQGESPDCRSLETTKLALSSIYRTVIGDHHRVYVIKFERL
jgi:hypothetical protein